MAAFVHVLAEARCIAEPQPEPPAMTLEDAARLLCELSCSVRLSDPEEDYQQLLEAPAMVDYAWTQAGAAGIPPLRQAEAHEARRILLAHHRAH